MTGVEIVGLGILIGCGIAALFMCVIIFFILRDEITTRKRK